MIGDIKVSAFLGLHQLMLSTRYDYTAAGEIWHGRILDNFTVDSSVNGPVNRESTSISYGQIRFAMSDEKMNWIIDWFTSHEYVKCDIVDTNALGVTATSHYYLSGARRENGVGILQISGPEIVLNKPISTDLVPRGWGFVRKYPLVFEDQSQVNSAEASINLYSSIPLCHGPQPSAIYNRGFNNITVIRNSWLAANGSIWLGKNMPTPALNAASWSGDGPGTGWSFSVIPGQPVPHINSSDPPDDLVGSMPSPPMSLIDETVVIGLNGLRDNPHPVNATPKCTINVYGHSMAHSSFREDELASKVFKNFNADRGGSWGTGKITLQGDNDFLIFNLYVGIVPNGQVYADIYGSKLYNVYRTNPIDMAKGFISTVDNNLVGSSFTAAIAANNVVMGLVVNNPSRTKVSDVVFPLVNSTGWRLIEKLGKLECVDMAPPSSATRELKSWGGQFNLTAINIPDSIYVRQRVAWSGNSEQDYVTYPVNPPQGSAMFDTYMTASTVYSRINAWRVPSYQIEIQGLREKRLYIGDHIKLPIQEHGLFAKPALVTGVQYTFGVGVTGISARAVK